jgi:DNA helicase II / ATP-dependent DNA helicase PcrA
MTIDRAGRRPRATLPLTAASERAAPVALDPVRSLLVGLDRQQRAAVTHREGPLLVVAGPGTGKTEVLTRRIAWLIATGRARASGILGLTFTERAADEMQARVDLLLPYGQVETTIATFHAFGDRLIREHGLELGLPGDPRVIGRSEAIVLMREHVHRMGLERFAPLAEPTRFAGALVDLFARAKEAGVEPADLEACARELAAGTTAALAPEMSQEARDAMDGLLDEAAAQLELGRAFSAYQGLLAERGLMDHADQVGLAVRLLEERPAVRGALRRRFGYVVVDEAQDADPQQLRLVAGLVGRRGNVTFVGDDDQAIYAFRGAAGNAMAALGDGYDGLRTLVLRRNYRSRAPILAAARRLIRHNDPQRLEVTHGLDKTLTAVRRSRRPVLVRHRVFRTAAEEADHVAADIRERLAAGAPPESIAVLVRSNADARPVLDSLRVLGVPAWFSGASGLFAHQEVRDVLSLLRVIADPHVSADLYAVMVAPPYGMGGEDLAAILDRADRRRRDLWSVCLEVLEQPGLLRLGSATRERLGRVVADIRESLALAHDRSAPEVLYAHLVRSGWLATLLAAAERGDDAPLRRIARLFEIVRSAADLATDPRVVNVVPGLRALIDAGEDPVEPDLDDRAGRVNVLTVHQAKGLEFAVVYVVGMAEGRFPVRGGRQALRLPDALVPRSTASGPEAEHAEERRLFYVALTRARDELVLSHAAAAAVGGRRRRPSAFLGEALGIPVELGPAPVDAADASAIVESLLRPDPQGASTGPADARSARVSLDLSFTAIDDYLTCPLKYRLRHQLRVPTPAHHALVVGSALHQAVASVNIARMRALPVSEAAALETFRAHWSSEGFLSPDHEEARFEAAERALRRYAARAAAEDDRRVLGVEQPFAVRFGPDRLRGRYDLVTSTPQGVVITDFKSGDVRDPARASQRARTSLQLQVYALAHEAESGQLPAAVELHFLEGDSVGRATPSARQLERTRERIGEAAAGIRVGRFEATPGYPACEWCPYRRICPSAA